MQEMKLGQLKNISEAVSNCVFLNRNDYSYFKKKNNNKEPIYVEIKNSVYTIAQVGHMKQKHVGFSKKQREFLKLSTTLDTVNLSIFKLPNTEYRLSVIKIELIPNKLTNELKIEDTNMSKIFKNLYSGQFFEKNQEVYFEFEGRNYFAKIIQILLVDSEAKKHDLNYGMIWEETECEFSSKNPKLRIKTKSNKLKTLFRPDFRFEDMGVGGLDKEIQDIFRRAFSSRRIPTHILEMYGIKNVKGMLLHGPPGTGKTLIARQLAKVLHAREPKIVNGPELFNKFVGETEKNVRELFADAKKEQEEKRENSALHIIIFDEFDAIAKHRGSSSGGTGVGDNIVNQLLSVIDGVESLDNILVIGMTNRIDLIDKAVLRPGRFEVHVEIGLPDEHGRGQILQIHTKVMRTNKLLGLDVDLDELAKVLKNYTGAEIEAVVKSANSFALNRHHKLLDFTKELVIDKPGLVELQDFLKAVEEVKPEFGVENSKLDVYKVSDLIDYGSRYQKILENAFTILKDINQNKVNLASVLLHGKIGTGKTSIAAKIAIESNTPFVKFVSSEDLIGKPDFYKVNYIVKCFEDAYKSKNSVIILDDLERLCEYVEIRKSVSNSILQAIMVLLKKLPQKTGYSLCIIATSSDLRFLREFGLFSLFNVKIEVPELSFDFGKENEIGTVFGKVKGLKVENRLGMGKKFRISIKKLLFMMHMMGNMGSGSMEKDFKNALKAIGDDEEDDDFKTKYSF